MSFECVRWKVPNTLQHPVISVRQTLVTSRVSGQGYRIGAVFRSVTVLALSQPKSPIWEVRERLAIFITV